FIFFTNTATTQLSPLSLHDALPIYAGGIRPEGQHHEVEHQADMFAMIAAAFTGARRIGVIILNPAAEFIDFFAGQRIGIVLLGLDRKSTRLNSSHDQISYAVFCLKK